MAAPNRWTMPLLKLGEKRYYLGIFFKVSLFFVISNVADECYSKKRVFYKSVFIIVSCKRAENILMQ